MNTKKKSCNSLIQLDNGSNYEVVESMAFIEMLLTDTFINENSFVIFHFLDGLECKIKKNKISVFYEYESD